jgi:acetyltransferase
LIEEAAANWQLLRHISMKTIAALTSAEITTPVPNLAKVPSLAVAEKLVTVKGHGQVKIRPIRVEDEQEMVGFHSSISEESVYMRYFEYLGLDQRTAHDRLVRICKNNAESYAVVMESPETISHMPAILAVGRLTKTAEPYVVSFDTLITNEKTASSLAKALLTRLAKLAQAFGFKKLTSELLVADHDTVKLCRALGFSVQSLPEGGLVRVTLDLLVPGGTRNTISAK